MDGASITAALGSAKTAFELVKAIRESDTSLEKAELRYKLAELFGSLADLKMELAVVQEDIAVRDQRIRELESAFELKDALRRVNDAYYRVGEDGQPHGDGHCVRCWEADKRQRSLVRSAERGQGYVCPSCKSTYRDGHAGRLA